MRHLSICSVAAVAGLLLAGCQTPEGQPDRTASGALIGGAVGVGSGALFGSTKGHAGRGALIGGAVGALAGGVAGHMMDINEAQKQRLQTQAPQTWQRVEQGQPLGLADIKALSQAGVSDEVIISQIRNSHTVYRLSTADIIDLKNSGVSEKVINFMINTPATTGAAPAAAPEVVIAAGPPPPPIFEEVLVAPGPSYIWVEGAWGWRGGSWAWVRGHWMLPPRGHVEWVHGGWAGRPGPWR